ncbi:hypothetical protein [Bdellovibrio sp. HCB-110]|uniref:hypothetical protein n=1 Tax=Bdellovibrio sp. HCB-110 TaxID=3391182 RepID=UPI0039B547C7
MKILVFLVSVLGSVTALAAGSASRIPANSSELIIDCGTPKNFSGLSASISGKLKLSQLPNGAAKGTGKLKISLLNPRTPWAGVKTVIGQYDDLTSVNSDRYFHGGATIRNSDDIMDIYVNFSRPEMSYVEYDNATYKMVCK